MDFDPREILRKLSSHDVTFIVVGGIAAAAHGSPYPTRDLDICPADDDAGLDRLAQALEEMDAKLMVSGEPSTIQINLRPRVLRSAPFLNFVTRYGVLDVIWTPAGTFGYDDLRRNAVTVEIGGVEVAICSLGDVIRSKSAILRDKDLKTLQVLREIEERRIVEGRGPTAED